MKQLSIASLVMTTITFILVAGLFWGYWQQNAGDTNSLTVYLSSRSGAGEAGESCMVQVNRKAGTVSNLSNQVIVKNADGKIVGYVPITDGEITDQAAGNPCVKKVTIEVEDSDYYVFSIFGWLERVVRAEHLDGNNWEIEFYLGE